MRNRTTNRSGIVIRRTATPVGDIIVSILTVYGKLKAVARGGVKTPVGSCLNLFHHVGVQIYQSPSNDLAIIRQAVLEGALPKLAQPERYIYAHLIAELADVLFQEGEFSEHIFEVFAASLRGISHYEDPEWVAIVMSYKLLGLSGIIPQTKRCARCGNPDPAHPDPVGGQFFCSSCSSLPAYPEQTLRFMRTVLRKTVSSSMENPVPAEQRRHIWLALERFTSTKIAKVHSMAQFSSKKLS